MQLELKLTAPVREQPSASRDGLRASYHVRTDGTSACVVAYVLASASAAKRRDYHSEDIARSGFVAFTPHGAHGPYSTRRKAEQAWLNGPAMSWRTDATPRYWAAMAAGTVAVRPARGSIVVDGDPSQPDYVASAVRGAVHWRIADAEGYAADGTEALEEGEWLSRERRDAVYDRARVAAAAALAELRSRPVIGYAIKPPARAPGTIVASVRPCAYDDNPCAPYSRPVTLREGECAGTGATEEDARAALEAAMAEHAALTPAGPPLDRGESGAYTVTTPEQLAALEAAHPETCHACGEPVPGEPEWLTFDNDAQAYTRGDSGSLWSLGCYPFHTGCAEQANGYRVALEGQSVVAFVGIANGGSRAVAIYDNIRGDVGASEPDAAPLWRGDLFAPNDDDIRAVLDTVADEPPVLLCDRVAREAAAAYYGMGDARHPDTGELIAEAGTPEAAAEWAAWDGRDALAEWIRAND